MPEIELVDLPGLTVPADAYRFLFSLLDRDFVLVQEDDKLRVKGPNGQKPDLSADDIQKITRWKHHILAMLAYKAPARQF